MVYVGTMEFKYGRMKMFHLASPNVEELHRMADIIGINRKWFQDPKYNGESVHPHYDICKSKKVLAIKNGVNKEIDDREIINICYPKLRRKVEILKLDL